MSLNQSLIAELQFEAASTRKILERVPMDNHDWKPHDRSMKLGRLATHVAELPGWITMVMTTHELDFNKFDYKPVVVTTTEELLAKHDETVQHAISILENATAEDFEQMWSMRKGEVVHFSLPKQSVLRTWAYSHQYHHRGQLSVYLRMLDIPVPGMYGPSADEMPAPVTTEAEAV